MRERSGANGGSGQFMVDGFLLAVLVNVWALHPVLEDVWAFTRGHPHVMGCLWVIFGLSGFLVFEMLDKRTGSRAKPRGGS
jgi:hypothetical protein